MSDVNSEINTKQLAKETALLRAYIRKMNASVEVYNVLKHQFRLASEQWMVAEILNRKKRILSLVQEVVLKREDTVEDTIPWFSVVTTNYFKYMSKLSFNQNMYIVSRFKCTEDNLSEKLNDLSENACSEKVTELVMEIKKIEQDIFDGLSVLGKLESPCNDE